MSPVHTKSEGGEASGLIENAREHLAIAKKMIAEMGYHRRDGEVEALEREILERETHETARKPRNAKG